MGHQHLLTSEGHLPVLHASGSSREEESIQQDRGPERGFGDWHRVPEQPTFKVTNWGHQRTLISSNGPGECIAFSEFQPPKAPSHGRISAQSPRGCANHFLPHVYQ